MEVHKAIKLDIAKRRVRPKEFFTDFDPLRRGIVSDAQFHRALGSMNLPINAPQLDGLTEYYRAEPGLVCYTRFCEDMDTAFMHPTESSPVRAAQQEIGAARTSVVDDQRVSEAIGEVKRIMRTKNISIKPIFQDFDRTNCGMVSNSQFQRVLGQAGLNLPQPLIQTLDRRFTSNGRFDYVRLCNEIDSFGLNVIPNEQNLREFEPALSRTVQAVQSTGSQLSLEGVLQKIRDEIKRNRVQLYEFIRDFDNLRTGIIQNSHLANALNMARLYLTEQELSIIFTSFAADRNRTRYVEFLQQIGDNIPIVDAVGAPTAYSQAGQSDEQIFEVFRNFMRVKNISIRPMFQDFDRTKCAHVTLPQFIRVCMQCNVGIPDQVLANFATRYMDKPGSQEVNYIKFTQDIENEPEIFKPEMQTTFNYDEILQKKQTDPGFNRYTNRKDLNVEIFNERPEDLNDLIAKIRASLKKSRVRLHEFLRDFDKLRSGVITKAQLASGMNMARIPLSTNEYNLLNANFGVDDYRINYKQILDMVEENAELKALVKDNDVLRNLPSLIKYGKQGMTRDENLLCEEVTRRFKAFVQKNYLDLKSHFQDWDRHNIGKISAKQFRQVLAQFKFNFSDPEFLAVSKKYDANGDINYVQFFLDTNIQAIVAGRQENYQQMAQQSVINPTESKFNFSTPYCMNQPAPAGVNAIMERVKATVGCKRIQARLFMIDYDPLRKGQIPKSKFRGALDNMRLDLTPADIDALESYFEVDRFNVNYSPFCDICDSVFTDNSLDKNPEASVSAMPLYLDPRDVLNDQEERVVHECLARIGNEAFVRRLHVKPFFQDKDRSNSGWVTTTRFRSILDLNNLKISDLEHQLLCRRFAKRQNEVNYVDFVEVLKNYSGDAQAF